MDTIEFLFLIAFHMLLDFIIHIVSKVMETFNKFSGRGKCWLWVGTSGHNCLAGWGKSYISILSNMVAYLLHVKPNKPKTNK